MKELTGKEPTLKTVKHPCEKEDKKYSPAVMPAGEFPGVMCPHCAHTFLIWHKKGSPKTLCGVFEKPESEDSLPYGNPIYWKEDELPLRKSARVEEWAKARSEAPIRVVKMDSEDVQTKAVLENVKPGMLGKIAASILMGLLIAARMARFDLLRMTCRFATRMARWFADIPM